MIIRKANITDLRNVMLMYKSCVKGMLENGIDQWDENYPNADVIRADIKARTYFIAELNGEVVGGINLDEKQDPTYLTVGWKDKTNSFLVVHRLAVKEENWGDKVGKALMIFAEEAVLEDGLKSIRLDTYSGNPKAMAFYRKLGYSELEAIDLKPNKDKYHCFEKIIK